MFKHYFCATNFSAPVQNNPEVHPAFYTMGIGVKRPGSGVNPYPSRAEVQERVELYLYSPSGPSWPLLGRTLPLPYTYKLNSCIATSNRKCNRKKHSPLFLRITRYPDTLCGQNASFIILKYLEHTVTSFL